MNDKYLIILVALLTAEAYASSGNSSPDCEQRSQYQANCSSYFLKYYKDKNGVPKIHPPIPEPLPCWSHIKNVGGIFCLLTGTDGYSRFDWRSCQLECKNSDFQMGLPFEQFNPDELVTCLPKVESVLKEWEDNWNGRKQKATENLCKHGN